MPRRRFSAITPLQKIILFSVMVVSIALILFSGVPFITKENVTAQLKLGADALTAYASESGSEASFTFGEVEIIGFAYDKKAKVLNPTITFSRGSWSGSDKITLSSASMLIVPDASSNSRFQAEFPEPLSVSRNGNPPSAVVFSGGIPKYTFKAVQLNGEEGVEHALKLPPSFTVTPAGQGTAEVVQISYDANPSVLLTQRASAAASLTDVKFSNITIMEPKTTITVGALSSTLERKAAEGGKIAFDSVISARDIGYKKDEELDGPYSIVFSAAGTRVAAVGGTLPPPDTAITLRELVLSAENFRLSASGTIARTAEDFLPFGKADVKVENFANLRNSNSLSPELKAAMVETASRITGEDASTADALAFTVQREKLGEITVGEVGFEEVLSTFLSRMMLGGGPPAPTPSEPAPEEDAPITDEKPAT